MEIFWEGRYASVAPSPLKSGSCSSQDPDRMTPPALKGVDLRDPHLTRSLSFKLTTPPMVQRSPPNAVVSPSKSATVTVSAE
jgi:hypothetical protein